MQRSTDRGFSILVVLLIIFSSYSCIAQSAQDALLILSKKENVLAIVNSTDFSIQQKIPVGEDPHELCVSADGKRAYVTIYGGGRFHTINVIDLEKNSRLEDIDTRPLYGPHGIVFIDGKLWFSAEGSKAVGRYDPASKKLDWSMGTGEDRSHMIFVEKDGKTVYTTNVNAGTVSILQAVNTTTQEHQEWKQTVIPTAKGSEGLDVSPDGKELWTASSLDGSITIIDLKAKTISAHFNASAQGANRLRFSKDGRLVFISSLSQNELIVFDAKDRKELKRIDLGSGAAGIEIDPNGKRIFVACTPANYVAVIDINSFTITHRIELGAPDGMCWKPG